MVYFKVAITVGVFIFLLTPRIGMAEIVESEFKPHPILCSAHVQTVWPNLFGRRLNTAFERERLELPDGDFLDLDWFNQGSDSTKLVVLIHGLGGSSSSHYIPRIGNHLVKSGYRVVVFNLRGATGPNRVPRAYHSGETNDLQYVLEYLSASTQNNHLYIIGFSLGGNILLKWLGEHSNQTLVSKAAAISVPFELSAVANRLNIGVSKFYRSALLKNMKKLLQQKESLVKDHIDLSVAHKANTFHEFDNAVTAPLNNFRDVDDYYTQSSSKQFLTSIGTPTLILHARDDPFTTPNIIPKENELGKSVVLELSDHGGHVGFIEKGRGLSAQYWLPKRILKYLQ